MSKQRREPGADPPCYAIVQPGLEAIAAEEIGKELGAEVKRTDPGLVVFRPGRIDPSILDVRTTEDVFLLAWGTDRLSYRAEDLERIRRWTAQDADWPRLLQIHHSIRAKPRGRPTYHLVAQMTGEHGYRRSDALKALADGLSGKIPPSWRPVEEDAAIEIWLTINGATATCGVRLSDRTMRHREYKHEHLRASLRPTVAAAMVRLAAARSGHVVLDPMCGAGTILAEQLVSARRFREAKVQLCGGDIDLRALRAAAVNLRRLGPAALARWDAAYLPLRDASVDRIITNPPFGKQLGRPEAIGPLYRSVVPEYDRVLRPGGRAVLLVSDLPALAAAVRPVPWKREGYYRLRVLGQPATLTVWRKGEASVTMDPHEP